VGGGGPTSQRRLVLEVGVFVFLVPLDGLLEAVDALHVGRNAVGIAGGRSGRGCGMAAVAGVEGVLLSRLTNRLGNARIARVLGGLCRSRGRGGGGLLGAGAFEKTENPKDRQASAQTARKK